MSSTKTLIDCNNIINKWNTNCNTDNPNQDDVIGNCNIKSTCYKNQANECKKADLFDNLDCKEFCMKNSNVCIKPINNYCKNLNLSTLYSESICNNDDAFKKHCINNSNKIECQEYCKNDINNCINNNKYNYNMTCCCCCYLICCCCIIYIIRKL